MVEIAIVLILLLYTAVPELILLTLLVVYHKEPRRFPILLVINPTINPAFSIDKKDLCKPGIINFSGTGSPNVESYNWDFGDGTPITSSTIKDISHNYTKYGNFTVTLIITSTAGCISLSTQNVTIQKPSIIGTVSSVKGCIPATINFNANVSVLPNDAVSGYVWKYGDGSPAVTTRLEPLHIFIIVPATIYLHWTITTLDGCTNTFKFDSLAFGIPPTNLIAYTNKNVICGSDTAVFVGKATNANFYIWDNGESIDIVKDTISNHKYQTLGIKKILVTPSFNGCLGKSDSFNITVIGVISKFTFANTCADKKTFSFRNRSLGIYHLLYGILETVVPKENTLNAVHTFPDTGTYAVSLIVNDNITGCSDTLLQNIYTANPLLTNPDQSICRNSVTTFTVIK